MTYALGIKCIDGVMLIADRKLTEADGTNYEYIDKIYGDITGVIWTYAGSSGTFELFRTYIKDYVERTDYNIHGFITELSKITHRLFDDYKYEYEDFEVLVGISGSKVIESESQLKHILAGGKIESAIGTASPHGLVFVKEFLKLNQSVGMVTAAELGYFIIKYIEKYELDMRVGLENKTHSKYKYPQVHFIPNKGMDYPASLELLAELEGRTFHRLNQLSILDGLKDLL